MSIDKDRLKGILGIILGVTAICLHFFNKPEQKDLRVGFVQNNVLLEEYVGIKEAMAKYQQMVEVLNSNVDTLKFEFENSVSKYNQEYENLSEKERALTEQVLRNKEKEFYTYKAAIDKQIEEEDQKITHEVLNQIDSYVVEYAKKNGYDFIFGTSDAGSLFYASEEYDLTQNVLKELNDYYEGKIN